MEVNTALLKHLRRNHGWTQQHLSDVSGLSLRTIQRIEKTGSASNESVSAICAGFEISREEILIVPRVDPSQLREVEISNQWLLILVSSVSGGLLGALMMYAFG